MKLYTNILFIVFCTFIISCGSADIGGVKDIRCSDSDGGKNFEEVGSVFEFTDKCITEDIIEEYYCSEEEISTDELGPRQGYVNDEELRYEYPYKVGYVASTLFDKSYNYLGHSISFVNMIDAETAIVIIDSNEFQLGKEWVSLGNFFFQVIKIDNELKLFNYAMFDKYARRIYSKCPQECQAGACV